MRNVWRELGPLPMVGKVLRLKVCAELGSYIHILSFRMYISCTMKRKIDIHCGYLVLSLIWQRASLILSLALAFSASFCWHVVNLRGSCWFPLAISRIGLCGLKHSHYHKLTDLSAYFKSSPDLIALATDLFSSLQGRLDGIQMAFYKSATPSMQ
jgi:hypothetical protein